MVQQQQHLKNNWALLRQKDVLFRRATKLDSMLQNKFLCWCLLQVHPQDNLGDLTISQQQVAWSQTMLHYLLGLNTLRMQIKVGRTVLHFSTKRKQILTRSRNLMDFYHRQMLSEIITAKKIQYNDNLDIGRYKKVEQLKCEKNW